MTAIRNKLSKLMLIATGLLSNLEVRKKTQEAASLTCDFLECLARYGFVVTPICDGEIRHHSKRASIDRIAKSDKSKIESTLARLRLTALTQRLRNDNDLNNEKKDKIQKEKEDLNKKVSKLENKSVDTGLPPSFASDLDAELEIRDAYNIIMISMMERFKR